jgi:hypothetical protein
MLLLVAAALFPGSGAEAQSPPHVFVGEVLLDGAPAPDGTPVRAVLPGRPLPRAQTTVRDGKYTLIVEEPQQTPLQTSLDEAVVGFVVGDFPARQSQVWRLGELTVMTLTATSALPPVAVEIDPPMPQRLERGQEFWFNVSARTGWHQVLGWTIAVDFDPAVFALNFDSIPGDPGYRLDGPGRLRLEQSMESTDNSPGRDGELAQVPLRVLDSAATGSASLTVAVGLTGAQGLAFPLDPGVVITEVDVVALAADLNGDDVVDIADLAALASAWGTSRGESGYREAYDLDGDGTIWIGDLAILLQSYQPGAVY